jgi:hypothetical protein
VAAGHYLSITGGGGDINYLAPEIQGGGREGCCGLKPDGRIVDGAEEMRKVDHLSSTLLSLLILYCLLLPLTRYFPLLSSLVLPSLSLYPLSLYLFS